MRTRTFVVIALLGMLGAPALAATFDVDPVHSSVNFRIGHMRVSLVMGRFNEFSGAIVFDAADPGACSVEMTVRTASVDTANAKRDEHLRSADFFDAGKHPEITFRGAAWKKVADRAYEVTGELTLLGKTREVTAIVEHLGTAPGRKGRDLAGFLAKLTIRRSEFGMTNMVGPIGDEVELEIAVEAIERPRAEAGEADLPPESNRMAKDRTPTPFSAEEIRRGCPPGRVMTYRLDSDGQDPLLQSLRFARGDEERSDFEAVRTTLEGAPVGKPSRARSPWKQLQGHGSFPAARTVISSESLETPVGTFDCWLYTVTSPMADQKSVRRVWFAKNLPGPPVKMTRHVNGKFTMQMLLVEHSMGPDSWDVRLTGFADKKRVPVIGVVRKVTGMKLAQSWEHVDYLEFGPVVVRKSLSRSDAEALVRQIREAGGYAEMVPGSGPPRPLDVPEAPPCPIQSGPVDVVLKMVSNKIVVIMELRAITGVGLLEAKELVDNLPATVKTGMELEEAKALKARLEKAGAIVRLRPSK